MAKCKVDDDRYRAKARGNHFLETCLFTRAVNMHPWLGVSSASNVTLDPVLGAGLGVGPSLKAAFLPLLPLHRETPSSVFVGR